MDMGQDEENKIKDAIDILESCFLQRGRDKNGRSKPAKYIWMVTGGPNPCDIRRYAFSHEEAVSQLNHVKKAKYKDCYYTNGKWELFKLVKVNKRGF